MPIDPNDPFAGGSKTPALSWKDLPIGSTFKLKVTEPAKMLQSRNFETGELDFWPADVGKDPQPKMSAVVNVEVIEGPHSIGETKSIWAGKPSAMFEALRDAQQAAGEAFAAGGTIVLTHSDVSRNAKGEPAHPTNPRYSPIKQYTATYTPPAAADPFGGATTSAPAQAAPQPGGGGPDMAQATRPVDDAAPF